MIVLLLVYEHHALKMRKTFDCLWLLVHLFSLCFGNCWVLRAASFQHKLEFLFGIMAIFDKTASSFVYSAGSLKMWVLQKSYYKIFRIMYSLSLLYVCSIWIIVTMMVGSIGVIEKIRSFSCKLSCYETLWSMYWFNK